jgi:2-polyprenyl-3-methyl-5-hydroxy-6-metoxy-1,4-benzoquinol methylase
MYQLTTKYFMRREPRSKDFEEAYWGEVTDPDGKKRNLLTEEERQKHLGNIKEELAFLNKLIPGRMLDIGCGPGYLLSALNDPKWEKHGLDVSAFACEYGKQWATMHVGTIEDTTFPDNHFDVIVMHHVIEHIPDPERTIEAVFKVLRPGGTLLICTPDFDSGCARRFGENYRLLHDPTHITLFCNESMHRFLRDHGFVIDRTQYPFFDTPYFTEENLMRLFDTSKVSPPFYGNFMSFYCHKPE